MIGCYLDESIDPSQKGIFAVGGLMGRGVPFFELDRKWEKLRKRPDIDIEFFKASQCERGSGQFSKFVKDEQNITTEEKGHLASISDEFIELIRKEQVVAHGVGVLQEDFYEVIKDPNARAILGDNPYRLAYDLAMIQCAWAMKELGTDYVSFVCDEHEKYSPLANEAHKGLKSKNPNAAKWMGSYGSADDKDCEPLQAADAVVFEIRRVLNLSLGHWKGELRPQFKKLSEVGKMYMIQNANKENLLATVATSKPGEPLNLDAIMEMHFEEDIKLSF